MLAGHRRGYSPQASDFDNTAWPLLIFGFGPTPMCSDHSKLRVLKRAPGWSLISPASGGAVLILALRGAAAFSLRELATRQLEKIDVALMRYNRQLPRANLPAVRHPNKMIGIVAIGILIVLARVVREMVARLHVSDASCRVIINRNDLISDYVLGRFHPIDGTTDELYPVVSLPALRRPGGG